MEKKRRGVIARTYPFFKKHIWGFWTALFFAVMISLTGTLLPQIPQLIIDRIINPALGSEPVYSDSNVFAWLLRGFDPADYAGMLAVMLTAMAVVLFIKYLSHYLRWNIAHPTMIKGENKIRDFAFERMLRQSPLVLGRYTAGDLMNVTNNDPTAIKDLYVHFVPFLLESVISMIFATFFLVRINPVLAIIPVITGIVTAVLVRGYNKTLQKKYNVIRQGNVELSSYVQENINGVRVIRAYATENDEIKRFSKYNDAFMNNYVDLARTTSKYTMIFTVLGELVGILSIIAGIILATRGYLSVGEFATFTSYCFTINGCIVRIAGQIGNIQNGVVCAKRFFEFADRPLPVDKPANPVPVPEKPDITMKNVSMRFGSDEERLKNVNVEIPYGKRVGIMGKTGSGKSVFMKLLTRLYDCTAGEVALDGIDVKKFDPDELRDRFSVVSQDVFLFSESVRNNIALYDESASEEKIKAAARDACVDKFADSLDEGYETIVGEKGLGLSGGQKQRVSIARALLKDAPIILLDDCTSALDYETEREITDNLYRDYGDRTTIISSHRAGSVAHCDEILYFEDGEIVERGTHAELMAMKGRYCEIFTEQEALKEEELD